jgi:hypothetical protein
LLKTQLTLPVYWTFESISLSLKSLPDTSLGSKNYWICESIVLNIWIHISVLVKLPCEGVGSKNYWICAELYLESQFFTLLSELFSESDLIYFLLSFKRERYSFSSNCLGENSQLFSVLILIYFLSLTWHILSFISFERNAIHFHLIVLVKILSYSQHTFLSIALLSLLYSFHTWPSESESQVNKWISGTWQSPPYYCGIYSARWSSIIILILKLSLVNIHFR